MAGVAFDSVVASLFAVTGALVGPFLVMRYQLIWPAATAAQRAEATRLAWKYGRALGPLQAVGMAMVAIAAIGGGVSKDVFLSRQLEIPPWLIGGVAVLALPVLVVSLLAQSEGAEFMKASGMAESDVEVNVGQLQDVLNYEHKATLAAALVLLPLGIGFVALGLWAVLPPY